MMEKSIKVKAVGNFNQYRNKVLKLKGYRDLQGGKVVEIPEKVFNQYPHIFKKEVKNAK